MAMTVVAEELTGTGPTSTAVSSVTFNRVDSINGTTPIPVPSVNTLFSWIKSFKINITVTGGLTMTNVLFGKRTNEAAGLKYWHVTSHATYTQATATPAGTAGNNAVGPSMNGATGTLLPLITAPPSAYAAGPYTTTGQHGNFVEVCVGVDPTVTQTGAAVALPNMVWQWSEA